MTGKQKVLIFIDWYKPAYKAGGPIQSMSKMIEFQKDYFEFYIFCGNKDLGENEPLLNVASDQWNRLENENVYYSSKGLNTNLFNQLIHNIQPDTIYINGIFSINFSIKPIFFSSFLKIKIVVASRGMLGEGAILFKKYKKELFLFVAKTLLFGNKKIVWHATDENEFIQIKRRIGSKSNVIKLSNFFPELSTKNKKHKEGFSIIFFSRISEKKNLMFAIECLSKLVTPVYLKIVGPIDDKKYFENCKLFLDKSTTIKYDFVGPILPINIEKQFEDVNYFILPTFHENFGHVIVESLSFKTPVIISQNTPFKTLEKYGFGYDLPLDKKDHWIEVLTQLSLETNKTYQGRIKLLEKNYSEFLNNTHLIKKYQQLLHNEQSKT